MSALAPRLFRVAFGLGGERDLAEDAAQEALVALVGRWRWHGPPESAEAFAFAVLRRRLLRARWRRLLLHPLDTIREPAAPRGVEAEVGATLELARVRRALAQLSTGDREILLLVAAGELDEASTAALLGRSRSAIRMRLHRARSRLRRLLGVQPTGESR